ncbi:DUF3592 domain-containing protein [Leifsonia poae]|uniref:DUF3592 domain-containing protein n=1 Tax=Leifsonia poae TaxID=110933 RepID=UPI001CC0337A|nr:DUF3592 domain-containing protein [Leifsonia poae]
MSTIDPRVARADREARAAKGPRSALAGVLVLIVHIALWVAAGYGLGGLLDTFRLMGVNQVGTGWDSAYSDTFSMLWPIAAVFAGSIFGFVVTSRLRRFGLVAAALAPFTTGTLGVAIGLALFIPAWTPAQAYGEKVPFLAGDPSEPWGFGSWVAYWMPVWLPALFAVAFLLLLLAALRAGVRAQAREKQMVDLAANGRRVHGTVTESVATGVEIQGMPRIRFTVRFTDTNGVDRWVTKKGTFPPASLPREGDPAVVWFDPLNPGDEKGIVVGLGPDAADTAR